MNEIIKEIPVINTFMHNGRCYMYDTFTNRLFEISNKHFIEVDCLKKIGVTKYLGLKKETKAYEDIIMLLKKGLMKRQFIEKIEHPETEYAEHLTERCINDLTLQVTRDCNFKCRYCLYANNSKIDRKHEKKNMPWHVAKDTVDFLFAHSSDVETITIAFYGGEPLLNFELITDVVEYAEELFNVKKIIYRMTTNGSILSDRIIDFIIKYNFVIAISLDGPKDIQNRHRKFAKTGGDTFDVVYSNIKKLKDRDEDYFNKNVSIISVVFDDENKEKIMKFFNNINVHKDKIIELDADLSGIDYYGNDSNMYNLKEEFYQMSKDDNDECKRVYEDKGKIPKIWHHNGPCIPTLKSMFVDVNGNIYPCERLIENTAMVIGNIKNGLNMEKIIDFINIGKLTEEECKSCWAMRFCNLCIAQCNDIEKNIITSEQKRIACTIQQKKALSFLKSQIDKMNGGI